MTVEASPPAKDDDAMMRLARQAAGASHELREERRVTRVVLIHEKNGGALYRLLCGRRWYVLKCFDDPASAVEVRAYELLSAAAVPTLDVCASSDRALLLEDIEAGSVWRPAEKTDAERAETGAAVAEWYRALHAAGRKILAQPGGPPEFLKREIDVLSPASVLEIGRALGLGDDPAWRLVADAIEPIKEAMRRLAETLNYNDFHWTNLALSQDEPLRAVVFDYHLLGIGLAYSDCRNVAGCLGCLEAEARTAFWEAYGPIDEREAALDAATAPLYGLHEALRRPRWPKWANALVLDATGGKLAENIQKALKLL